MYTHNTQTDKILKAKLLAWGWFLGDILLLWFGSTCPLWVHLRDESLQMNTRVILTDPLYPMKRHFYPDWCGLVQDDSAPSPSTELSDEDNDEHHMQGHWWELGVGISIKNWSWHLHPFWQLNSLKRCFMMIFLAMFHSSTYSTWPNVCGHLTIIFIIIQFQMLPRFSCYNNLHSPGKAFQ